MARGGVTSQVPGIHHRLNPASVRESAGLRRPWRAVDRDLGWHRVVGFDFDHGELAGVSLGQCGAGPVGGEDVRVAVAAEGRVVRVGVIPRAGGQLDDAGADVCGEGDSGQAAAAVVEQADAGVVGDASYGCVGGVHGNRLASADLAVLAVGADVELAVQPSAGLVGHELKLVPAGVAAEPFGRLEPDRVPGAVGIAEAVDGRGEDLDLPAGGGEREPAGIAPELGQQHLMGVGNGDRQRSARPEPLERRHLVTCRLQVAAPLLV
jgi:hypothetical protein